MIGRVSRFVTRSTIVRFVLLSFVLQATITVGALLFVQQQSQAALAREQRQSVAELHDELLEEFRTDGQAGLSRLIADRLQSPRRSIAVLLLVDQRGQRIVGNLEAWPATVPTNTAWRAITLYRSGSDLPENMGVVTSVLPDGSRLLAGHVTDGSLRLATINANAIGLALLGGLVLALIGALLLGRLLSAEFGSIRATADAFAGGQLSQRIHIKGTGDSFDALGTAINAMLDRIERLIAELRVVTDGLAHDLKSPVTRLKSVIERAVVETRDASALAALERAATEADTLMAMLTTTLLISRTEAGIGRASFVSTDMAALIGDIAEIYGPLAEDRGFEIQTTVEPNLRATIHKELVSRAIGNLIENAISYSEGGSIIAIDVRRGAVGEILLSVSDNGPGIPAERYAEALARFGRLDPARTSAGSGLGLSLVGATAHLHGGTIALEDAAPGLRVAVRLIVESSAAPAKAA